MLTLINLRIIFAGFPFFVSGRSASTGQFFPTHVALSSHEDTRAWKFGYEFVINIAGKTPRFRMVDSAPEITKAIEEVFRIVEIG